MIPTPSDRPTDDDQTRNDDHDLRSYGRRRGRKLSERQTRLMHELLPRVRPEIGVAPPAGLARMFPGDCREVWLEIGFGGGEHLLWHAAHDPSAGIIGCEPFEDGIVKVLTAIEERSLRNIRVWPDDARAVLRWLPAASIARAFVLFPDPWPKRKHQKRRLLSAPTLASITRVLKPGGELRIGTDIPDYMRTIFMALQATPGLHWTAASAADWRRRPVDWPETRYEQKAVREGRRCVYLSLRRV